MVSVTSGAAGSRSQPTPNLAVLVLDRDGRSVACQTPGVASHTSDVILVEDEARIRTIALDRPEARNAFNEAMYDAVREALTEAQEDPNIAAVVVTGTGDAFSAGQDLGEMERPTGEGGEQRQHGFVPFTETLETFEKPLVAAVNGVAVGIGFTMLAYCDLVLVAESARFRAPFVSLGVAMEAGSSYHLPQRIGWQETADAVFTSGWIDADRAVDIGLAWRRLPDLQLMGETMAVAREIGAMPVDSLRANKRLLNAARLDASRAAREREHAEFARLLGSPAQREAIKAFLEKRPPDFTDLPPE